MDCFCPICDYPFQYEDDVDRHLNEDHLCCHVCSMEFRSSRCVDEHLSSGTHPQCQLCPRKCDDHDDLQAHFYYDHHACLTCKRPFSSAGARDQHEQSGVHNSATFPCLFCDRTFRFLSAGIAHVENNGCRNQRCDRGAVKQFIQGWEAANNAPGAFLAPRLTYPDQHSEIDAHALHVFYNHHSGCYDCPHCERSFRGEAQLRAHLGSKWHASTDYSCACGRLFVTLADLVKHYEQTLCKHRPSHSVQHVLTRGMGALEFGR
jgi:hypothetical protein